MAITFTEKNDGKLLEVGVSGKLHKDDYREFVPEFERLVRDYGKLRVLFDMKEFHGWDLEAAWEDIKFDVRHFSDIERIAMVGDKAWENGMANFCRPFTSAKIRYFDKTEESDARAWINAN